MKTRIALAALAALTLQCAVASATMPGFNGVIAMTRWTSYPNTDLYALNPDGSANARMTSDGQSKACEVACGGAWSADGTQIAFACGYHNICVMNADGSARRLVVSNGIDATWSPDGKQLAYSGRDYDGNNFGAIRVVDVATGASHQIAPPAINPDGTRIAFGGGLSSPSWSPDGSTIAFTENNEIRTIHADGSGFALLPKPAGMFEGRPDWSPDGSKLLLIAGAANTQPYGDIYTMRPDGSGLSRVADGQADSAVWSPDGKKIAAHIVSFAPTFRSHIWTLNADGSGRTDITPAAGYYQESPSWQPVHSCEQDTTGAHESGPVSGVLRGLGKSLGLTPLQALLKTVNCSAIAAAGL